MKKSNKNNQHLLSLLDTLSIPSKTFTTLEDLILFGSRSRNENRNDSDVDLMLVIKDVDVTDRSLLANSVFFYTQHEDLNTYIKNHLGVNPDTKEPYVVELVGSHELRKFKLTKDVFDYRLNCIDKTI